MFIFEGASLIFDFKSEKKLAENMENFWQKKKLRMKTDHRGSKLEKRTFRLGTPSRKLKIFKSIDEWFL